MSREKLLDDIARLWVGTCIIATRAACHEGQRAATRSGWMVQDITETIRRRQQQQQQQQQSSPPPPPPTPAPSPPPRPKFKLPKKAEFNPVERKVPSSQIGRALSFGGIFGRLAIGAATEAAGALITGATTTIAATTAAATSSLLHTPTPTPTHDQQPPRPPPPPPPPSSSSTTTSHQQTAPLPSALFSESNVERLAAGLCRLRGAALKVGQMLSIQDESLLPPQLQAVLARVRDQAEVMPHKQLMRVLVDELGHDWRDKLASFDMKPIAAASIGQVHEAVLPDGERVAMKIQYPGVAKSIDSDIANLKALVQLMAFLPRGLYLDDSMAAAKEELALECDYINEAACQRRFRELLADDTDFYVPRVIDSLSTRSVLTTELIRGVPLSVLAEVEVPTDHKERALQQTERNRVASALLRLCLRELFEWRFLQSDPNWSNFLYDHDTGVVNLVDFGATRRYKKSFVDDYLRMVKACADRDRDELVRLSIKLGFLTGDESANTVHAHVAAGLIVGEPFATDDAYDFATANMAGRVSSHASVMVQGRLTPPPKDSYTLHRKLSGAFLSCKRLGATISCRDTFMRVYDNYVFDDDNDDEATGSGGGGGGGRTEQKR